MPWLLTAMLMGLLFTILGSFLFIQSLTALLAAVRWRRYALRALSEKQDRYIPKTAVIIPCRGIDPRFRENIEGYLAQDYRHYEIIFVTESASDPAYSELKTILNDSERSAWLITSGEAQNQGQKVHNLCTALDLLDELDRKTEVLVFADADALPEATWLRDLVTPLFDRRIGATTGFRWYAGSGVAANLLSVWNASALSLLGERSSFAWGGATAITRDVFEDLKIKEQWESGAVSDDFVLSRAIHREGLKIKFVPQCLVVSEAHGGWRELLEFTTRQIIITRVYSRRVWWLTLVTNAFYSFTLWGGIAAWAGGLVKGWLVPGLLIGGYLLGSGTGWVRRSVAAQLLVGVRVGKWAFLTLHPVVSILYLYNLARSIGRNRIVWRGIGYEMRSPVETVIWKRPEVEVAVGAGEGKAEPARTGSLEG